MGGIVNVSLTEKCLLFGGCIYILIIIQNVYNAFICALLVMKIVSNIQKLFQLTT